MKKTKLKRVSKQPISKLQRKLWVLCKLIIRKKYGNNCYTCLSKNLVGKNWQTGHMLPKARLGANLKYDIRVLRPQCSSCNIWGGGMGAQFLRNMIIREGQPYVDQIFRDKSEKPIRAYDHYLLLIEKYNLMLEELNEATEI